MKLKLNKKTLKQLSLDTNVMSVEMTPKIAGGAPVNIVSTDQPFSCRNDQLNIVSTDQPFSCRNF
ncbi:MAG: hypothetical protein ACI8WB_001751 [Phenylobacterium sp.]|jgi:hypothetical protein